MAVRFSTAGCSSALFSVFFFRILFRLGPGLSYSLFDVDNTAKILKRLFELIVSFDPQSGVGFDSHN